MSSARNIFSAALLATFFGLGLCSALIGRAAAEGLPLPRFASIDASEVNLRAGPGLRYPVEWTFIRRDQPVEIINEFDTWRNIRDWEGTEGWVHQSMLSGRRTVIAIGADLRTLRREPAPEAPPRAMVEPGAIGLVETCPGESPWCRVSFGEIEGWLLRADLWGVYAGEAVD